MERVKKLLIIVGVIAFAAVIYLLKHTQFVWIVG